MRILVVEDERALAAAITRILTESGHTVTWAPDGRQGTEMARTKAFELIVLDVLLPLRSGWDVLAGLRAERVNIPILMLTAMDEVRDRVKGLNLGADDYLAKPFDALELVARVNALLRRDKAQKGGTVIVDDLTVDRTMRKVTRSGQEISLTRREYDLLEALAINQGSILSPETIQERVWGDQQAISNTVAVYIGMLRKKIDFPFGKRLIHTVVGFGYVLRSES